MRVRFDETTVSRYKEKYPVGTKVICLHMDDEQAVPSGTIGAVHHVDDVGTIHVHWENGSGLGLIPGEDEFHVIND